ncbi:LamG-like jellyroll fold domain-containing protein, partial [Marinobacter sp.]|uniref:DUF7483 domain-containing protein n=1 Tax=Marinobacter sp. TaxID=50741 RepID=UPI000C8DFEA1
MAVLNNNQLGGASGQAGGYFLDDSLRFRKSAGAYLNRTPSTEGNRKTFTLSTWIKRGQLGVVQGIFDAYGGGNDFFQFQFDAADKLSLYSCENPGVFVDYSLLTDAVYRDTSAWYHIVLVINTPDSTQADRAIVYVNGVRQSVTNPSGAFDSDVTTQVNTVTDHNLGRSTDTGGPTLDGYLTEVNFVDGTALSPSDFGETDNNGTWIPKKYTGTYGTNGFYLPMKPTTQATGFNTVLYAGNSASQTMTNVGFAPDLVWYKRRTGSNDNTLIDSVRGGANALSANGTAAEYQFGSNDLSFTSTGFTLTDTGTQTNASGQNYVAWCWDAGDTAAASNTDGDITSTVKANQDYGFSIATFTGNGLSGQTIGHGLSQAPELYIWKRRDSTSNWGVQYTIGDGSVDFMLLNLTNTKLDVGSYAPTSTTEYISSGGAGLNVDGGTYVVYSFHSVTGYQKIGSYTGNGSTTGPTITTGFRPRLVMAKCTNSAGAWHVWDSARQPNNPNNKRLLWNTDDAEATLSGVDIDFNDNGFQLKTSDGALNGSGDTYIFLAIADTTNAKFNFDASGNKNNWTPNNINSNASGESTYDLMSDVPTLTDEDTSNFATLNPNNMAVNTTMTDGNLKASNSVNHATMFPTNMPTTGKYYFECKMAVNAVLGLGFRTDTNKVESAYSDEANKYYYYLNNSNAYRIVETTNTAYGSNLNNTTSTFQVAIDFDAAKYYFGRDNTWYAADWGTDGDPASGTNPSYDLTDGTKMFPFVYVAGGTWTVNFGQQPFTYTPPSGFKKINTFNLPDSTIKDGSERFDTALYTGTGSTQSITGLEFQPDFLWL